MLKHIHGYENRGKSLRLYGKNAAISYSKMQYLYYKRYRKGTGVAPSTGFTEVVLPKSSVNDDHYTVEVKLANGIQIVFNKNISVEQLKAIL